MVSQSEEAATEAVARAWGAPRAELESVSLAATFPWCKRFTPFLVVDKQRHRAAAASDGQSVLCFASDPKTQATAAMAAKIQALNALFDAEKIAPRDLTATRLAEAARTCLREPGGFVATRQLFTTLTTPRDPNKKALPIDAWLYVPPARPGKPQPTTTPEVRRAMFETHAVDPVFTDEDGSWRLGFNFFTLGGAVEKWELQGRPDDGITHASISEALPPGTFTPPFG